MGLPLALPLAPGLGPGAAAALTLVGGGLAKAAQQLYGFRTPLPPLPRVDGKAGAGTLAKLLTDAAAGARIPVALPPNPLGPKGSLAGLLLGALAGAAEGLGNLWGYFNGGRGAAVSVPNPPTAIPPGTEGGTLWETSSDRSIRVYDSSGFGFGINYAGPISTWFEPVQPFNEELGLVSGWLWIGTVFGSGRFNPGAGFQVKGSGTLPIGITITSVKTGTTSQPLDPAPVQPQWFPEPIGELPPVPTGFVEPERKRPMAPPPVAPPQVVPGAVPVAPPPNPASPPGQRPGSPTTPAKAPPVPLPGLPVPWWAPANPPAPVFTPRPGASPAQQTSPDGGIVPQPAQPVPVTDPGSVIPWPGAAPIPGTGLAPAPTLQGIAQEVGRIERKLEVMNTPNAPGNLVDQIGNLQDLIGPIVELILAATSGTVYTLDSPCEVDGDGKRLPAVEVEAPGGLTQFGAILNRIDALAELLQVHKDLKQPNCRGADVPVGGEFVTVNFEQID